MELRICKICNNEFHESDDVAHVMPCKYNDPSCDSFEFSSKYDVIEANCVVHIQCFLDLIKNNLSKIDICSAPLAKRNTVLDFLV